MFSQRPRLVGAKAPLSWGIFLTLAGCVSLQQSTPEPPPVIAEQAPPADTFSPDLNPGDYSREIARLKKVTKTHPDRSERIKAHLHLSALYASYKNPENDYRKALEELTRYTALNPDAAKEYDVQNWLHFLREICQLREKNVKLGQAIEELKLLDQQIEQKRERYR